ncbi:MAG TPA: hypothetical protein VMU57_11025, partial [Edaphobacter sp.]|uniref:hypothetical protein n=1 Tax=Edaphobacter sp. TaxID=1934404 RepID=UPI002BCE4F27
FSATTESRTTPLNPTIAAWRPPHETEKTWHCPVTTEVPFTGNWNPDPEEILTIDVPQEAQVFEAVIRGNATAVPTSLYWWMRVIAPRQANTAGIANSP